MGYRKIDGRRVHSISDQEPPAATDDDDTDYDKDDEGDESHSLSLVVLFTSEVPSLAEPSIAGPLA